MLRERLKQSNEESLIASMSEKYSRYETFKGVTYLSLGVPEMYLMYTSPTYYIPGNTYDLVQKIEDLGYSKEGYFPSFEGITTSSKLIRDAFGDNYQERNSYVELVGLLGENYKELESKALKGLAYNLYKEYTKSPDESPLSKLSLQDMLEHIDAYIVEGRKPDNFRINSVTPFQEAIGKGAKDTKVELTSILNIAGDLQAVRGQLELRVRDLQSGIDYLHYHLGDRVNRSALGKLKQSELDSHAKETKLTLREVVTQGAKTVQDVAEALGDGSIEERTLLEYLERYRGVHEPLSELPNKIDFLGERIKDSKVDTEILTIKSELDGKNTSNLEGLLLNLNKALETETYKLEYVEYLLANGQYARDAYFSNLA